MNLEHILWLFLCFSVLGWVLETTLAAIRTRRYVDPVSYTHLPPAGAST